MIIAEKFEKALSGVFRWEAYSPSHKVELTSHAVAVEGKIYFFDPILLLSGRLEEIAKHGEPAAVILTNTNHSRSCREVASRWRIGVWMQSIEDIEGIAADFPIRLIEPAQPLWRHWKVHPLPGGAPGETAFFLPSKSLMVFGDAIVNLVGRGLEMLPDKYCQDAAKLRENLRQLVQIPFDNAIMAHGVPLIGQASEKIRKMLDCRQNC